MVTFGFDISSNNNVIPQYGKKLSKESFARIVEIAKSDPFELKIEIAVSECVRKGFIFKHLKKERRTNFYNNRDEVYNFEPFVNLGVKMHEITEVIGYTLSDPWSTKREFTEAEYIVAEIDGKISSNLYEQYREKVKKLGIERRDYIVAKHRYVIDQFVERILSHATHPDQDQDFAPRRYVFSFWGMSSEHHGGIGFEEIGMERPGDVSILCSIVLIIHDTLTNAEKFKLFLSQRYPCGSEEYSKFSFFECDYFFVEDGVLLDIKKRHNIEKKFREW